jgi:histidinol-phosphate aminotransferase
VTTAPTYKWQPTSVEIAAAAGIAVRDVVRFDHNTSPMTPEWASELAAFHARALNEYPGASYRSIREAAAGYVGLEPDQIMPGAGADELILLVGRAFMGAGTVAVTATPTYPLYEIATAQVGARFVEVPARGPAFEFPLDAVLDEARDADVVWLCVPWNPIGTSLDAGAVEAIIAATDGIVVADAAYAEFDPSGPDWTDLVERRHNLIVLRTMSKGFGLAGIRVGFAMAHPSLVAALDAVRPPGSIASISVELAVAALGVPHRMTQNVERIIEGRNELRQGLAELGLRPMSSTTNFLLTPVGAHAPQVAEEARREGLVIRTFATGPLSEHLRFTVRSPDEHARLFATLQRSLR